MTSNATRTTARALGPAFVALFAITGLYLAVLVWADARHDVFAALPRVATLLPTLLALAFVSYLVRYARWHRLLARAGHRVAPIEGLVAYLAGFAFTATPGKAGELFRIRYFARIGVPASRTLSAFVFERALDLTAVLLLSLLAATRRDVLVVGLVFVALVIAMLLTLMRRPGLLRDPAERAARRGFMRVARLVTLLADGIAGCRVWMNPRDLGTSFVLGLVAWMITAFAFVLLVRRLGLDMPPLDAFAIYPLSMLAGAASMLPGGVGSTEATIVLLLTLRGAPLASASLAAIGIRFASLWFAVLVGLVSALVLEVRSARSG